MKKQKPRKKRFKLIFLICIPLLFGTYYFLSSETLQQLANNKFNTNSQKEYPWNLILVNKWNKIPKNYEVELTTLSNGEAVDSRIYPALQEMFDSARLDGVYPVVVSSYRSRTEQQILLDNKTADYMQDGYSEKEAQEMAEKWVAIPDTSEHQLGISIDINADPTRSTNNEVYTWLDQNAYKFGFIYRYPADKTEITGIINEPWHYRYVGVEAATDIYNRRICLEEYLGDVHQ